MVYGTKGMVACSQPLAAQAGLEILRLGGNAADAAVAVSAALNVLGERADSALVASAYFLMALQSPTRAVSEETPSGARVGSCEPDSRRS